MGHGMQLARPRAVQRAGERVDREVAPLQILDQRCGLHLGQCPRDGVALAASRGDVDPSPLSLPPSSPSPLPTPLALLIPFARFLALLFAHPLHDRRAEALVLVYRST